MLSGLCCRYGFLYEEYHRHSYNYEALIMVRKLLISMVLVFLGANSISRGAQVRVKARYRGYRGELWGSLAQVGRRIGLQC